MSRAQLTVLEGPRKGETLTLTPPGRWQVGRGPQAHFQLLAEGLSRNHCEIAARGDGFTLRDLGSKNGTALNGRPIEGTERIEDGDLISLADVVLAFRTLETENDRSAVQMVEGDTHIDLRRRVDVDSSAALGMPKGRVDPDEMQHLAQGLTTLVQVGNLLTREADLDRQLGIVMDSIMKVSGAQRGCILLAPDPGTNELEIAAARGLGAPLGPHALQVSRTVVDEVLRTGESVMSSDAGADDRFRAGDSIVLHHIRSVLCVPIESHDARLGVIYADHTGAAGIFSERTLELLSAIGRQAGLALARARAIEDLQSFFFGSIGALVSAVEAKDPYTRGHTERVTAYGMQVAAAAGLSPEQVDIVRMAAMLHDIGKVWIPTEVLNKPGRLTDEEFDIIKTHPTRGAEMLAGIPHIDAVKEGVLHHHERWDGKGYPDGLAGEKIPVMGRLLAVGDAFDAMASSRAYRKALSLGKIREELARGRGSQWDPFFLDRFVELLDAGEIRTQEEVPHGHFLERIGTRPHLHRFPLRLDAIPRPADSNLAGAQ